LFDYVIDMGKEKTLKEEAKESIHIKSLTGLTPMGLARKYVCPKCGTSLPRARKPTSIRQMLFGGWTCPNCKVELNNKCEVIKRK
jgi:rubredoxin